jgi:hypothetical protein
MLRLYIQMLRLCNLNIKSGAPANEKRQNEILRSGMEISIKDERDISLNRRRKQQMEGGKTSRPFSGPQDEKLFARRRFEVPKQANRLSFASTSGAPAAFIFNKKTMTQPLKKRAAKHETEMSVS